MLAKLHQLLTDYIDKRWREVQLRRKFFDDLAEQFRFDPLIATNWYAITTTALKRVKACFSVTWILNKIYNCYTGSCFNSKVLQRVTTTGTAGSLSKYRCSLF